MYQFKTLTGVIEIDQDKCMECKDKPCITACPTEILTEESGKAVLAVEEETAKKGKCIECLACELDCEFYGNGALKIDLPLPEANS